MSIFSSSDGRGCDGGVLRVNTGCPITTVATIAVDTFSLQLPITGYSLDMGTNHQFLHSLDNFIYLYAFGDRIGELTLSGMSFTGSCVQNNGGGDISAAMGQCSILSYYKDNRVSNSEGTKVSKISLGNCSNILCGFLTGMRLDMPNPSAPIVQWALRYHVVLLENKVPSIDSIPPVPAATGPTGAPSRPYAASPAPSGGGTARDGTYNPGGGRFPLAPPTLPSVPVPTPTTGPRYRSGRAVPPDLPDLFPSWPNFSWPNFAPSPYPLPPPVVPPGGYGDL